MKTVKTMLTHPHPYPHEHSQHALLAVVVASIFLISTDNMHTLVHKLEDNIKWYVGWLLVEAVHHLPSFQSMGVDLRMNLSLFLTLFLVSVLALAAFHVTFLGFWYPRNVTS